MIILKALFLMSFVLIFDSFFNPLKLLKIRNGLESDSFGYFVRGFVGLLYSNLIQ